MELTEEQKERIRKNRERALEIRRRKKEEEAAKQALKQGQQENESRSAVRSTQHAKTNKNTNKNIKKKEKNNEEVELEEFEVDASPFVTKQEAMKKYCLPAGTLEVCSFEERVNPRNAKFSMMKLYDRSEIRRRARERFGGLEGLVEERRKREMKRFERDFEDANDIFKVNRKKRRK